jgi:MinD-like ATPase involved in chromosome partitioning or flagellar assembly
MAATAMRRDPPAPVTPGYELPAKRGPMVAVRALCGGAGASTLAYLIAASAAIEAADRRDRPSVLLCDAASGTGGVALYAGVESNRALDELANALAADRLDSRDVFAVAEHGLRVLGTGPRLYPDGDRAAVARLLRDGRDAHGLTVVDCGTLTGRTGRLAVLQSSHVVSIFPATELGVLRAQRVLASVAPREEPIEALVARADGSGAKASTRALARLAEARRVPLVLMPRVQDQARGDLDAALEACQVTLQAIATLLRR